MEAPFIIWTKALKVGHAGLDVEHGYLVEAINGINAAIRSRQSPDQLKSLVSDLKFLAKEHFKHEDLVLRKISSVTPTFYWRPTGIPQSDG